MNWIESMSEAIQYIEDHLDDELNMEDIAGKVNISSYYFQKVFSLLCGFTVGEYIRNRRLANAGNDILTTNDKIISIAAKYGYDSSDSFTKAFTRFHGSTPTAVRKDGKTIRTFAPLQLKFTLEGGYSMDYKIIEKEAFKIVGVSRMFNSETSYQKIPVFWNELAQSADGKYICGKYGVCIETGRTSQEFKYMIADDYDAGKHLPDHFEVVEIPKHTWAVFPCIGALPNALQKVNTKIFSEWLPNCTEYEMSGGYDFEVYDDSKKYEKGTMDDKYYSEIWIPLKRK